MSPMHRTPEPLALCLEDVSVPAPAERFVRCVALIGRQPGLGLDEHGELRWQCPERLTCELWVSADDRLVLFRPVGAAPVRLHRAERMLDVPEGKPVFVLGGDEIELGARRLRLHLHGPAPRVHGPSPLERPRLGRVGRAAAVVAIGAAVAGCDHPREAREPIEVREQPPSPPAIDPVPTTVPFPTETAPDAGGAPASPDASMPLVQEPGPAPQTAASATATTAPAAPPAPSSTPPIDVRMAPPDIMPD